MEDDKHALLYCLRAREIGFQGVSAFKVAYSETLERLKRGQCL